MKDIPIRKITTARKELTFSDSFSIRKVEDLLNGKDLIHQLHRHDFFFILALQKGKGIHEIDFVNYEVHDNAIFMLRPGQVHQLKLHKDSTGFLMEFAPSFYQPNDNVSHQRLNRASKKNFCEMEAARQQKLLSILLYIFNEFTEKQEGYIEVIKANLAIFFIEFIRQSRNPHGKSDTTNAYAQERLEDFLDLLRTHITTHKQVSTYAGMLNLSVFQLNKITRETVDKPASELINEQIILEAKRYLLATSYQVKDIADQLGYEDISYFIRFYKKHTGITPEAFRKNSR
jgi:AraC family transcriptional regulator, transcriptional activator of pobA